jgi:hypothetical protein
MEYCHNCKNKIADYICDICRRYYCDECDQYIHSFSYKNKHIRKKIEDTQDQYNDYLSPRKLYSTDNQGFYVYTGNINKPYSSFYKNKYSPDKQEDFMNQNSKTMKDLHKSLSPNRFGVPRATYNLENNDDNFDYYEKKLSFSPRQLSSCDSSDTNQSLKKNKSFNSNIARCNLNSFCDKMKLMKKISQLNCQLSNARCDIDQKIDSLHDHMHNFEEANKKSMIELNNKNINEINVISNQKDILIKHLKDLMNDQDEEIQKLLKRKSRLEHEINENKFLIDKYNKEKNGYLREKENNKNLYEEKKNMLIQRHECQIQKIRNDYDKELEKLANKYSQSKCEYMDEIQKENDIIDDYKIKGQKQVEALNHDINELQNENDIINKEQENILNSNKTLKQSIEDFNGQYEQMNLKYKNSQDETNEVFKNYLQIKTLMEKRKKENEKLHNLKYGRF